ncbi:MAG: hypothetical protein LK562_03490, partial [Candidatus Accumulibacter phosphatis]|nr:hypothetical protein [Candidatus Accumulibacter phosphatis]
MTGSACGGGPWRCVGGAPLIAFPDLPRALDQSLVNLDATTPRGAFHQSDDDLITSAQQRLLAT